MARRVSNKRNKLLSKRAFWFRKLNNHKSAEWGFIPLNWKGWVALLILIGINVFAANYFNLKNFSFQEVSSFLIVFLLSLFVFIEVAIYKTKN